MIDWTMDSGDCCGYQLNDWLVDRGMTQQSMLVLYGWWGHQAWMTTEQATAWCPKAIVACLIITVMTTDTISFMYGQCVLF